MRLVLLAILALASLRAASASSPSGATIQTGAAQTALYLPLLQGKRVALVANHTTLLQGTHLLDTLLALQVQVAKVMAPEHGFRGTVEAGGHIGDQKDPKTGVPLVSLYGKNKKPSPQQLKGVDLVVFDLQDVGTRFYTYISTLHYVMEACAEQGVPLLVLDRPNPNGHYVDGPILEQKHRSFVGMHPIPVVHGMTMGELAQMINGEGWLPKGVQCLLRVIPCAHYQRTMAYTLPVPPSPNLPNMLAIYLYPSTCFFEGTSVSLGRGTPYPFQVYGSPEWTGMDFSFTPQSMPSAKHPPHEGKLCHGRDLRHLTTDSVRAEARINLSYVIDGYQRTPNKEKYFTPFFNTLAGNTALQKQIREGKSAQTIRASWQAGLEAFRQQRKPYLLYPDLP